MHLLCLCRSARVRLGQLCLPIRRPGLWAFEFTPRACLVFISLQLVLTLAPCSAWPSGSRRSRWSSTSAPLTPSTWRSLTMAAPFLWWIIPNFHVPVVNIFQIPLSYGEYSPTFTFPWWIISNFHFPKVNVPKFSLSYGECSLKIPFLWWIFPNIALSMVNIRQFSLSYGKYSPTFPFIWWIFPNIPFPMVNIPQHSLSYVEYSPFFTFLW